MDSTTKLHIILDIYIKYKNKTSIKIKPSSILAVDPSTGSYIEETSIVIKSTNRILSKTQLQSLSKKLDYFESLNKSNAIDILDLRVEYQITEAEYTSSKSTPINTRIIAKGSESSANRHNTNRLIQIAINDISKKLNKK